MYDSTIHGTSGNLTIGETVTYLITVTLPQGQMTNLSIVDTLPAGFTYTNYSIDKSIFYVLNTLPVESFSYDPASRKITFNFLGITNITTINPGNIFSILVNVTVLNNTNNTNGTKKNNTVALNWTENTRNNFTAWVNTTIVEPNLKVDKSVTPTTVDGGDLVTITLTVTNNGTSPAYQIELNDVLDPVLFNTSEVHQVLPFPTGFSFTSGSTVIIKSIGDKAINPGEVLTFIFTVLVDDDVPTGSVFQNQANISFSSMPAGYDNARNYTNKSNVVNINTVTPGINKTVINTSEPDSATPNVMVGEVVTYQFVFTVPEGETFNVSLIDNLLSNLGYNVGTALIKRSNANITASGFNFGTSEDTFLTITPNSTSPLTFYIGNVTYFGSQGLKNGTITLIFNATGLNIAGNQAGTLIPNNATLNFTNSTGGNRNITIVGPTLTVTVPQLTSTKTATPTVLTNSGTATFRIQIINSNSSTSAPAYEIIILDPINGFTMDYLNMVIVSSDPSIVFFNYFTANLINITVSKLGPGQYLNITYNATVKPDVTFSTTLNNTVNATGTTLPGPHGTNNATPGDPGTSTGERTGDPTQPAGPVNDIKTTATAPVTTRSPRVSKTVNGTKTVNLTIGDTATESINVNLPVGSTTELKIIDVLPDGLGVNGGVSGFTYATTSGVNVNQFLVTYLGGNTYQISFGNVTITQEGNITINYTVLVRNVTGNYNGINLVNNATLYYNNQTGQGVNGGSDTATVHVVEPNLQITKTPSKTNLNVGEEFTYTLVVAHTTSSTSDAYNLKIIDIIPTGLQYVAESAVLPLGWTLNVDENTLTFTSPLLTLLSHSATLLFNCTVNNSYLLAGQNITNTANLNYTSKSSGGRNYTTNSSTQIHVIGADLLIKKEGDAQVNAGEPVTYTITVTNLGPDTAINTTINDIFLSPWFTYLINPQYSLNFGTWTSISTSPWSLPLGDIASGNTTNIRIRATINSSAPAGILNNTVNVTSNTTDPNPNNNNSTATTNVTQTAVLTLLIENNPTNIVLAGNNIVYTLTLTNTGPSVARDVTLTDNTFSSYYLSRFYSYSINGGLWSSWMGFSGPLVINVTNTSIFPLGYMGVGDIFRVMINGTVNASTPNGTVLLNNATANSTTSPFNVTSNTVRNNVETSADVGVTKVCTADPVVAGNSIGYVVVVRNYGPSDAQNVVVSDVLPVWILPGANYTAVSNSHSGNDRSGTWSYPQIWTTLYANEFLTLTFSGVLNASTPNATILNNTVNVTSLTPDPNLSNNNATNLTTVTTSADVGVTKVGPDVVTAGTGIVYTVVVTNYGPSDSQVVVLNDVIPSWIYGVTYSAVSSSYSGHDSSGVWLGALNWATVFFNEVITLTFNGVVNASTPNGTVLNNSVNVSSLTPDPNLLNNNATKLTNVTTLASLNITKTSVTEGSDVNNIVRGYPIHYTIVITNEGQSDALNVNFDDYYTPDLLENTYYSTSTGIPWTAY